jgi:hypothetical protein
MFVVYAKVSEDWDEWTCIMTARGGILDMTAPKKSLGRFQGDTAPFYVSSSRVFDA